MSLLEVNDLKTYFETDKASYKADNGDTYK